MGVTPQADIATVLMRVGGADEKAYRSHVAGKLQEIYDRVAASESITAARSKLEDAKQTEAQTLRAHQKLNKRLAVLRTELQQAQDSATQTVVECFADDGMSRSDIVKAARPLEAALTQERVLLWAIDRIALRDSFTSKAAAQTVEAELYEAFAAALDTEAESRLRKTQELAAAVVEFEGEVDLPGGEHTASGALQQSARSLRGHAANCRKAADELLARQAAIASQPRPFRRREN